LLKSRFILYKKRLDTLFDRLILILRMFMKKQWIKI